MKAVEILISETFAEGKNKDITIVLLGKNQMREIKQIAKEPITGELQEMLFCPNGYLDLIKVKTDDFWMPLSNDQFKSFSGLV